MHRVPYNTRYWDARSTAHIHQLRGTPKPNDENVHAQVYEIDERVQQKSGEPRTRRRVALHVVQLRSRSQDAESDACDGSRSMRPRLDNRRNRSPVKLKHYPGPASLA